MSARAPAYQGPIFHFGALRLVALREGGGIEETLETDKKRNFLHAHLRTYTQSTQLLAAGSQLTAHSQNALQTGLMAPAWRPALCIWGVIPDLTWLVISCEVI